jgi:hypothetical protein
MDSVGPSWYRVHEQFCETSRGPLAHSDAVGLVADGFQHRNEAVSGGEPGLSLPGNTNPYPANLNQQNPSTCPAKFRVQML